MVWEIPGKPWYEQPFHAQVLAGALLLFVTPLVLVFGIHYE
jgi:hypothetical protein